MQLRDECRSDISFDAQTLYIRSTCWLYVNGVIRNTNFFFRINRNFTFFKRFIERSSEKINNLGAYVNREDSKIEVR